MGVSFKRIDNLARRLGVSFREAARLVGRKGARVRRERARQCACLPERPASKCWWQEGQYE